MGPEKRVADAVVEAQAILARYVEPGPRNCEQTISKLLDVLDDEAVVQAVEGLKMEKPTTEQLASSKGSAQSHGCRTNPKSSPRRRKPRPGSAI